MFVDQILPKIEKFLVRSGMAPTTFGVQVVKDPGLVFSMRDGRELRHGLRDKVVAFMEAHK